MQTSPALPSPSDPRTAAILVATERLAASLSLASWGELEILREMTRLEPGALEEAGLADGALDRLVEQLESALEHAPRLTGEFALLFDPVADPRLQAVFERAASLAAGRGEAEFVLADLLRAIASGSGTPAAALLASAGFAGPRASLPAAADTGWQPIPLDQLPTLASFAVDLTQLAADGRLDPVIGREAEMRRVMNILARRIKNNAVLVGDAGTGKTAIVEGIAQRIAAGEVQGALRHARVFAVDLGLLVANTTLRGQFEERLLQLLQEVRGAGRRVILFFDEFHTVVGAGGSEGALDAANILKPALARGEITVVAATTWEEYSRYVERDRALERRMSPVFVREPSEEEAVEILRGLRSRYEAFHAVSISDDALPAAVSLAVHHLPQRRLPDKAIDLLDEACAATATEAPGGSAVVDAAAVAGVLGIEPSALGGEREAVSAAINEAVVGQEEAAAACERVLAAAAAGLLKGERPLARILFAGPVGAGKRTAAEALALARGTPEDLVVLGLADYRDQHELSAFYGSPPGYVGFDESVAVLDQVRKRPYASIIVENAGFPAPAAQALLRRLLTSSAIPDRHGRRVSLANTVVIALVDTVEGTPPDFPRRGDFDEVVEFRPAALEDLMQVLDREVERLNRKLAGQAAGPVALTPVARGRLADESLGAGPAEAIRLLGRHIASALDRLSDGAMTLDWNGGSFTWRAGPPS